MLDPDPNTDNHAHMNIWCKIFTIGSLQTGKHFFREAYSRATIGSLQLVHYKLELPQNNLPKCREARTNQRKKVLRT